MDFKHLNKSNCIRWNFFINMKETTQETFEYKRDEAEYPNFNEKLH